MSTLKDRMPRRLVDVAVALLFAAAVVALVLFAGGASQFVYVDF